MHTCGSPGLFSCLTLVILLLPVTIAYISVWLLLYMHGRKQTLLPSLSAVRVAEQATFVQGAGGRELLAHHTPAAHTASTLSGA